MASKMSNQAILRSIAAVYGGGLKSVDQATAEALEGLMREIGCARISLWRFERQTGSRGLRCFVSKLRGQSTVEDSTLLREDQYREYYKALVCGAVFVSNDAMSDARLLAMRGVYLKLHNISALLDVPVTINGRAYGIVCCEQVGAPYRWLPAQILAARESVTRAGLLLAREPSIRLGDIESMPIEPF
jgi:GAF domain-containing protein